ncbi:MAG: alanine racemase [Cellvibrio sp.]
MKSCGRVIIDLAAIKSNWQFMVSKVTSNCEVAAVIKDDAYGLGAIAVGKALFDLGCRTFFFITPEEANQVSASLPAPITSIILGGVRVGNEHLYLNNNYIPVIHSFEALERWLNQVDSLGDRPVVLKFDTGMSRLGFSEEDITRLIQGYSHINPIYFISHLACADSPEHSLNALQFKKFNQIVEQLEKVFPLAKKSLANTSGIFLGKEWHFDLVRPGAGLYGISPNKNEIGCFKGAVKIELPILQVKHFTNSAMVGYGATVTIEAGSTVAVIAGGYADGLNRIIGNSGRALYRGYEIQSLGRMSMDSMIFDLSSIPQDEMPVPGEHIQLVEPSRLTLDYWMSQTSSLGYEILTALGHRLERVYVDGA